MWDGSPGTEASISASPSGPPAPSLPPPLSRPPPPSPAAGGVLASTGPPAPVPATELAPARGGEDHRPDEEPRPLPFHRRRRLGMHRRPECTVRSLPRPVESRRFGVVAASARASSVTPRRDGVSAPVSIRGGPAVESDALLPPTCGSPDRTRRRSRRGVSRWMSPIDPYPDRGVRAPRRAGALPLRGERRCPPRARSCVRAPRARPPPRPPGAPLRSLPRSGVRRRASLRPRARA